MNVYFLVEGRRTERILYPAWLGHAVPALQQVQFADEVEDSHYFLTSAEGYPGILHPGIADAAAEVAEVGRYTDFVVVLDADDVSCRERFAEVEEVLQESRDDLLNVRRQIIVQHRCLETWLLGNRHIVRHTPQSPELRRFMTYYNVRDDDPEAMPLLPDYGTHGVFHEAYLKAVFRERGRSYSKQHPGPAQECSYFEQLRLRATSGEGHLASFAALVALCDHLRA